jgi:putative aminopeptidase FrvX
MASLTVRNIPDDAKLRFRQIAAAHGRSMEEHLRQLVLNAGADEPPHHTGVRDVTHEFRHFDPITADPKSESRARIERLIELGRGIDWAPEPRKVEKLREIDFG